MTIRGLVMMPINAVARWFEPPRPAESANAAETRAQSRVIDRFLSNLRISAVRYSRLVDVTYRSADPGLSARIANALAENYIRQSLELRSTTTKEASDFLTQQLGSSARSSRRASRRSRRTANEPDRYRSKSARTWWCSGWPI